MVRDGVDPSISGFSDRRSYPNGQPGLWSSQSRVKWETTRVFPLAIERPRESRLPRSSAT